jgi:hypothetical protein
LAGDFFGVGWLISALVSFKSALSWALGGIRALGMPVLDVLEPFNFRRYVGQALELCGR